MKKSIIFLIFGSLMSFNFTNAVKKISVGSSTAKAVLFILADHADVSGKCFPSIKYIAKLTEFSSRSVKSAIQLLESKKILQIQRKKGKVNVYNLMLTPVNSVKENQYSELNSLVSETNTPSQVKEFHTNHQVNQNINTNNGGTLFENNFLSYNSEVKNKMYFKELLEFDKNLENNFKAMAEKRFPFISEIIISKLFVSYADWYFHSVKNHLRTPHQWACFWIQWIENNKTNFIKRHNKELSMSDKNLNNSNNRTSNINKHQTFPLVAPNQNDLILNYFSSNKKGEIQ